MQLFHRRMLARSISGNDATLSSPMVTTFDTWSELAEAEALAIEIRISPTPFVDELECLVDTSNDGVDWSNVWSFGGVTLILNGVSTGMLRDHGFLFGRFARLRFKFVVKSTEAWVEAFVTGRGKRARGGRGLASSAMWSGMPEPLTSRKSSKDCGGDCGCKGCGDKPGAMMAGSRRFANAPSAQQASALAKGPVFTGRAQKSRAPAVLGAQPVGGSLCPPTPEQIACVQGVFDTTNALRGWPGTGTNAKWILHAGWPGYFADHIVSDCAGVFPAVGAGGVDLLTFAHSLAALTSIGEDEGVLAIGPARVPHHAEHWGVNFPEWLTPCPFQLTPLQRRDIRPAFPPRFEDDPRFIDYVPDWGSAIPICSGNCTGRIAGRVQVTDTTWLAITSAMAAATRRFAPDPVFVLGSIRDRSWTDAFYRALADICLMSPETCRQLSTGCGGSIAGYLQGFLLRTGPPGRLGSMPDRNELLANYCCCPPDCDIHDADSLGSCP